MQQGCKRIEDISPIPLSMKTIIPLIGISILCLTSATARPHSTEAPNRKEAMRQKMMKKFDTNKDGILDANEKAALKKYREEQHAKRRHREKGKKKPL